jgi:hypothetical protein
LLKHKRKLRKSWQETRDPTCKTAINWVTRNVRRMAWKGVLERCETKLENCEVTLQAMWRIVEPLSEMAGAKAPSAIHGPLGPIFYPVNKANIIAHCLENQSRAHDLRGC